MVKTPAFKTNVLDGTIAFMYEIVCLLSSTFTQNSLQQKNKKCTVSYHFWEIHQPDLGMLLATHYLLPLLGNTPTRFEDATGHTLPPYKRNKPLCLIKLNMTTKLYVF